MKNEYLEKNVRVLEGYIKTLDGLEIYLKRISTPRCRYRDIRSALLFAIKVINSQIPKNIKINNDGEICPFCNRKLDSYYKGMKFAYCKYCGQSLVR